MIAIIELSVSLEHPILAARLAATTTHLWSRVVKSLVVVFAVLAFSPAQPAWDPTMVCAMMWFINGEIDGYQVVKLTAMMVNWWLLMGNCRLVDGQLMANHAQWWQKLHGGEWKSTRYSAGARYLRSHRSVCLRVDLSDQNSDKDRPSIIFRNITNYEFINND